MVKNSPEFRINGLYRLTYKKFLALFFATRSFFVNFGGFEAPAIIMERPWLHGFDIFDPCSTGAL